MKIGFVGAALSHPVMFTQAIREMKTAEVVGLWGEEQEQARVEKFAADLELPVYCTCDEVIDKSDAVVITTETHRHKHYAMRVLEKGKPVFVDKPFATCYADAADVLEKARSVSVPVMSCSVLRYAPAFGAIADRVRSGDAGQPISAVRFEPHGVRAGDWQDRVSSSGGFIFNFGIHCIDTLQRVLGPYAEEVFSCAGKLRCKDVESYDTAVVMIRFANGAVGTAEVIGSMSPGEKMATAPHLRVFCSELSMEAKLIEDQAMEYRGVRLGVSPFHIAQIGVHDTMRAFIAMVESGKPAIAYEEMLEVMKILEAARKSAAEGCVIAIRDI